MTGSRAILALFGIIGFCLLWNRAATPALAKTPLDAETKASQCVTLTAELFGKSFDFRTVADKLSRTSGSNKTTLESARQCLISLGLRVKIGHPNLSLLRERGGVALLQVQSPQGLAVVSAIGAKNALIFDGENDRVVSVAELNSRYTGEALVLNSAAVEKAVCVSDDPVRMVRVTGEDTPVVEIMPLVNRGKETLQVAFDHDSCGCYGTRPQLSAETIPPGGKITVTIPMHNLTWGSHLATVVLRTSDPILPRLVLGVQSQAPSIVVPNPTRLRFETPEGKASHQLITLTTPSNVVLTQCYAQNGFLRVKQKEVTSKENSKETHFELTLPETTPSGNFTDEIVFVLKNGDTNQVTVPVSGHVEPDRFFDPAKIFLATVEPGTTIQKVVTLQSHNEDKFSVNLIKSSQPTITVSAAQPETTSAKHTLVVRIVVPQKPGQAFHETVSITMEPGRKALLEINGMIAGEPVPNKAPAVQP